MEKVNISDYLKIKELFNTISKKLEKENKSTTYTQKIPEVDNFIENPIKIAFENRYQIQVKLEDNRYYFTKNDKFVSYSDYNDIEVFAKYFEQSKKVKIIFKTFDNKVWDYIVANSKKQIIQILADKEKVTDIEFRNKVLELENKNKEHSKKDKIFSKFFRDTKIKDDLKSNIYVFDEQFVILTNENLNLININSTLKDNCSLKIIPKNEFEFFESLDISVEVWDNSIRIQLRELKYGDKVVHKIRTDLGKGEVLKITSNIVRVDFFEKDEVVNVNSEDLELVVEPIQMLRNGTPDPDDDYYKVKAKFLANYLYSQNFFTGEFNDVRIDAVPHQLLALQKVLTSKHGGNMLFADDVGLGKTIEACLVIDHIMTKNKNPRILLLIPAGLKLQWKNELWEKFGYEFSIWNDETNGTLAAFGKGQGKVDLLIVSQQRLARKEYIVNEGVVYKRILIDIIEPYDLIVVDECHRASGNENLLNRLINEIKLKKAVKQILLLSATPHSGDNERFISLLNILDDKEFPRGYKKNESMEKINDSKLISEYIYRNDKLSVTDFDGTFLFNDIDTKAVPINLEPEEKKFFQIVMQYIRHYYTAEKENSNEKTKNQIGFVAALYRKILSSSWRSMYRSIIARSHFLIKGSSEDDLTDFTEDSDLDEREKKAIEHMIKGMENQQEVFEGEIELLQEIINTAKELIEKNIDTKLQVLINILNENSNEKVVIFTQYVKTLEIIKKAIVDKFPNEKPAIISGKIPSNSRLDVIKHFQKNTRFMVSTEAGGEGINLQFAHILINFDMPWNPSRIQQRVGRVWRFGQKEIVKIYNFYVADSADDRVIESLDEKLNNIMKNFIIPSQFGEKFSDRTNALCYDLKMKILGDDLVMQRAELDFEKFIKEIGLREELVENRIIEASERIIEAYSFVKENEKLQTTTTFELKHLENFYSNQKIHFLEIFAETILEISNSKIKNEKDKVKLEKTEDGFYKFSTKLVGFEGIENIKYSFKRGTLPKDVYYFGFKNDFFNKLIDFYRQNNSLGYLAYVEKLGNYKKNGAILCVTAQAKSPLELNMDAETYPLILFFELYSDKIKQIKIDDLFEDEWGLSYDETYSVFYDENEFNKFIENEFKKKSEEIKKMKNKNNSFIIDNIRIESIIVKK